MACFPIRFVEAIWFSGISRHGFSDRYGIQIICTYVDRFTRPGKQTKNELERSTMLFMGTSTKKMVMFHRFLVCLPGRVSPVD